MNEFLITLFFGWLGIHKFMQKKIGIGVVYLFTYGLFGIGWLYDVITSFQKMQHPTSTSQKPLHVNKNPIIENTDFDSSFDDDEEPEEPENPNRIQFSVAGVTFNNDDGSSRQEFLKYFFEHRGYSRRDVRFVKYLYEGENAVYVYVKDKLIGNVPKEYASRVVDNLDTLTVYHLRIKQNRKGIYYSIIDILLNNSAL